jgi:carboxylesterase type B
MGVAVIEPVMSLATVICLLLVAHSNSQNTPIAQTAFGKIQGLYTEKAIVYREIPYASPVDGANRWKDSIFPSSWEGVFDATKHNGIGCPQICDLPQPNINCPRIQQENCLLLNIFTPHNAKSLPVYVFFHGGEFYQGYGGSLLYDGENLANATGIIVVTVNYRLGALGFLVYGNGDNAINGNFGIKDQRLALQWIKMNIASFGGDPNDITIGGQSAGSVSIGIHMTSIRSSSLFQKAIIESNPFGVPLKKIEESKRLGEDFAKAIGCGIHNDFDCLFSKSFSDVANATKEVNSKIVNVFRLLEMFLQWTPVVDQNEIVDQPLHLLMKGEYADVPLLIGNTAQEGVMFIYQSFPQPLDAKKYDELLLSIFSVHYNVIHSLYPPSNNEEADDRMMASVLGTDETFTCPNRLVAREMSNQMTKVSPIYHYVFNHSFSFKACWEPNYNYCKNSSCHGVELPFVFKTAELGGFKYTSEEITLTNSLMQYWGNFIKYGNPNGNQLNLLEWPVYSHENNWPVMKLKTPSNEIINIYRNTHCNVLDQVGYNV